MYVPDANSSCLLGFVLEKIYKCGLSTFNLRGDDRFFAHKRIDKPVDRRHHLAGYFKTRKGLLSAREQGGEFSVHFQWWVTGRKRVGDKRGGLFASDGSFQCSAGDAHVRVSRKSFFTNLFR